MGRREEEGERSKKWPVNCGDRKKGGDGDITPKRRTHTTEYNSTVHPISPFFVGFVLNFSPSLVMRENLLRSPFHIFGGSPLILAGIPARISPLILIQFPKYCPLEGKELLVKICRYFLPLCFHRQMKNTTICRLFSQHFLHVKATREIFSQK